MRRTKFLMGALLGFLSSLILMALSYLGNALLWLPFFPFDLFDWLARHLPVQVIDTNIRMMVNVISALHLGPTDSTAKLVEQSQSIGMVAFVGILLGLVLTWTAITRRADLVNAGLAAGTLLWLGMVAVELSLGQQMFPLLEGAVWLLVLFGAWGWLLARGLGGLFDVPVEAAITGMASELTLSDAGVGSALDQVEVVTAEIASATEVVSALEGKVTTTKEEPEPIFKDAITRRNFFYVLAGGVASLFVLVMGLFNFRQVVSQDGTNLISPPDTGAQNNSLTGSTLRSGQSTGTQPSDPPPFHYGAEMTSGPAASPSLDVLAKRIAIAPGTRNEITPADQFYRIDIDSRPQQINSNTWQLVLKGLVQKPLNLSLAEIRALPAVTQAVTMACISNPVGGDLTSTNFWTGARLKDVLAMAGLMPGARFIAITAQDGFYEGMSLDEAMDERALLVYAMNGAPLTPEHGYPLRIYIPNHYGMKQPKWIIQIELIDHSTSGYWEERGWSPTAIPQTTSVIDTTTVDTNAIALNNGVMPLGGIAWAGIRGISKVEISINQGEWVTAELRTPALSLLSWVQWRYDWKVTSGAHQVQVRATDGSRVLQVSQPSDPSPEGATGIYVVGIRI